MFNYAIGKISFDVSTENFNTMLKNNGSNFLDTIDKNDIKINECKLIIHNNNGLEVVAVDFNDVKNYFAKNKNNLSYTIAIRKTITTVFVHINTKNTFENTLINVDNCTKKSIFTNSADFVKVLDSFKG